MILNENRKPRKTEVFLGSRLIYRKIFIIAALLFCLTLSSCSNSLYSRSNSYEKSITDKIEQSESVEVGSRIRFWNYYWIVLEIYEDSIFIITENVIFHMPYYRYFFSDITWENSDIRNFLNNDFLKEFTPEEQKNIIPRYNHNYDNEWYRVRGGENTKDYIFLLSISEVVRYFGDSGQLTNPLPPPVGVRQQWLIDDEYNHRRIALHYNGTTSSHWWLRSPGFDLDFAALVLGDGIIFIAGSGVNDENVGVRPALLLRHPLN